MTDARVSLHAVAFLGASLDEYDAHWTSLGLRLLSLTDAQSADPGLASLITRRGYTVGTVFHLFSSSDELNRVIDLAAAIGARCVYLLTGGRGTMTWEQAAERFCAAVAPCRARAADAGVGLAIENASALYADIHIAHTLRDTETLAGMAGLDVVVDLFHCWAEAGLMDVVTRMMPAIRSIQLSDYVLGDRALPARAVPGDGVIPIERFVHDVLDLGYDGGFDVELLGPRIDAEGPVAAARRACAAVSAMLER